jgi:hypothetical protein
LLIAPLYFLQHRVELIDELAKDLGPHAAKIQQLISAVK